MAAERKIDHIEYGGEKYEFVDSEVRSNLALLSTKVNKLDSDINEELSEEVTRAQNAEQALENSKVTKVAGKGLSTNDFTDEDKAKIEDPDEFTGATEDDDGTKGVVPAPEIADKDKYLKGDGTWDTPPNTTYEDATESTHGLMSATDKVKLNKVEAEPDDFQGSQTTFVNNVITEALTNGRTKTTTFNNNGTITQVITKTGVPTITLTTTFNNDGSITRVRT